MTDTAIAIPLPILDPPAAFAAVAGSTGAILLDGAAADAGAHADRARYSYICADPVGWIEAGPDGTRVDGRPVPDDPFAAVSRALAARRGAAIPGLPPFQGGVVGMFGYELGGRLERLPPPQPMGMRLPDLAVGVYDMVAAFDHAAGRAWVIARGGDPAATRRAEAFAARLSEPPPPGAESPDCLLAPPGWRAELSVDAYAAAVSRVLDYIRAGDIYQANFTQRFLGRIAPGVRPFDLYRRLRGRTAAPFSAFLNLGDGRAVASGSPERFLRMDAAGRIETRPIKGTRPRGATPQEDAALAADLLGSEKDRAENLMIVDLLRNDLSRVAEVGSVRVPELCRLESYRTVHHLTSVVEARLKPGLGPVDLLRATFPGGSITGAPKIRAMEIIRELEPSRRGPYCGSIAWIGFDGAMDSSIVIRTLCMADGMVQAQAGGGIVADSDPAGEYRESLTKARAMLTALDPGMVWPPAAGRALMDAAE